MRQSPRRPPACVSIGFPDTGYTRIGSDAAAIMGYARQYDTQIVLKEDGQDAKQYLRTFALDDNAKPAYSLRQGAEAAGAVSPHAIDVLNGTPYYLSPQGVMGIYGTYVTEYRTISGVSQRINPKLCRENLSQAAACVWDGKYYLAVGTHCYVADSRQMTDGIPEWYYWENIPAPQSMASISAIQSNRFSLVFKIFPPFNK